VRRLQDDLEIQRSHRLEYSEGILQHARERIQALQHSVSPYVTALNTTADSVRNRSAPKPYPQRRLNLRRFLRAWWRITSCSREIMKNFKPCCHNPETIATHCRRSTGSTLLTSHPAKVNKFICFSALCSFRVPDEPTLSPRYPLHRRRPSSPLRKAHSVQSDIVGVMTLS
jgi:hypothetical protein